MAISFTTSQLTKEMEIEFVKDLTVVPMKKGKPAGMAFRTYFNDGKNVVLPYRYGHLFAKKHKLTLNSVGPYKETKYSFTGSLRDYQIAGLEIVQEHLETYGTSTVSFHPGAGKTVIGSTLAYMGNMLSLVMIHRNPLCKQWIDTIEKFTIAKVHVIGKKRQKYTLDQADIIICMDGQLKNIPPSILAQVGTLLIDEAHCFCTEGRSHVLINIRPRYIVALTATPDRSDGCSSFLVNMVGSHRILRPYKKPFDIICHRTKIKPEIANNAAGNLDWTVYTKSLMEDSIRNHLILQDVLNNSDRKILILTKETSHVDRLKDLISPHRKVATMMGSQVTYEDSPVLIGTMSKINTGFDVATNSENYDGRPIDMVIICISMADENVICQSAGRGLRSESPIFYYYLDNAKLSENHWKVFRAWARKCGGKVHYNEIDTKDIISKINSGHFKPKPLPTKNEEKV